MDVVVVELEVLVPVEVVVAPVVWAAGGAVASGWVTVTVLVVAAAAAGDQGGEHEGDGEAPSDS